MSNITVSYKEGAAVNQRDAEAVRISGDFGGEWTGSGFGFGERDLEFSIPDQEMAGAMQAFLNAGFQVHLLEQIN